MRTPKNLLILLLFATTVGGAALAWHQYKELVELRGSALSGNERADLQKKIWDLQRENRELQDRLAAAEAGGQEPSTEVATDASASTDQARPQEPRPNGRWRGGRFGAYQRLASSPEGQALMNSVAKVQVDARYAPLFKNLNLTPDQADKLSALLIERQSAMRDVFSAAREQGINPRTDPDGFNKLVSDTEASINDGIRSLIGDAGMSQLDNYEQTMPQRNLVNLLQNRLSYSGTPLTPGQADQLVQILATTSPSRSSPTQAAARAAFGGGGMDNVMSLAAPGAPKITDQAVSQAGAVLNSQQLTALQQLEQQQRDAQQLRNLMRNLNRGGGAPAPAPKGGG